MGVGGEGWGGGGNPPDAETGYFLHNYICRCPNIESLIRINGSIFLTRNSSTTCAILVLMNDMECNHFYVS